MPDPSRIGAVAVKEGSFAWRELLRVVQVSSCSCTGIKSRIALYRSHDPTELPPAPRVWAHAIAPEAILVDNCQNNAACRLAIAVPGSLPHAPIETWESGRRPETQASNLRVAV